jgi:hypothetical protein
VAFYVGARFGIVGVATAIAIRAYLYWPVRLLALRAGVGVPLGAYLLQWSRPVLCGVGMVLAMLAARAAAPDALEFTAELVVGSVAYVVLLRVLAPVAFRELLSTLGGVLPKLRKAEGRPLAEAGPR